MNPPETYKNGRLRASWRYCDISGSEWCTVARYDDDQGHKAVIPFKPDGTPGLSTDTVRWPYLLEKLAGATGTLYITEGEKCASALSGLGLNAATSLGGCESAHKTSWSCLGVYREAIILPDADGPGERYAATVAEIFSKLPGSRVVKIARLTGLPEGGDVCDWIQQRMPGWDGFAAIPAGDVDGLKAELLEEIQRVAKTVHLDELESGGDDDWAEMAPVDGQVELPEWPKHGLPEPVQSYVKAVAESHQVPETLAAVNSLGVLAGCVQGRASIEIKADYREPLSLYVACALDSGTRKSSTQSAFSRAVYHWERLQRERLEPQIKAARVLIAAYETKVKATQQKIARTDGGASDALVKDLQVLEAAAPEPVIAPCVISSDITPEALVMKLAKHNECQLITSDEAGILSTLLGTRYSQDGENLDVVLSGHAAMPCRVDRKNGDPVMLENPHLSVLICPQPSVLEQLGRRESLRGRGLLARFLWALPESPLGTRAFDSPSVSPNIEREWRRLIFRLLDNQHAKPAGQVAWEGDDGDCAEPVLRLTREARACFQVFWEEIERAMADGGDLWELRDWAGKLPGMAARIAGIMHCVKYAFDDPLAHLVDIDCMHYGLAICRWAIPHAVGAFRLMGQGSTEDQALVSAAAWIRKRGQGFTRRELHQAMPKKYRSSDCVQDVLEELESKNWIRLIPARLGQGKASYQIHPSLRRDDILEEAV